MMERPQLRLFFGFSVFAWVTLFLTYLDYRYTLIPRFSYHQGKVSEELFIRKFGHVYPNSTRKTKQILLWTGFFDSPKMWDSLMNNNLQRCSFSCVATTNRQYLHLSFTRPISISKIFRDYEYIVSRGFYLLSNPRLQLKRSGLIRYSIGLCRTGTIQQSWANMERMD